MMNFSTLKGLNIPEGKVVKIQVGGETLWEHINEPTEPVKTFNYVSFGDSISAGHFIDSYWYDPPYNGGGSQIGNNGNKETLIVENCYVDLIRRYLERTYGESNVTATSFSRSGSRLKMTNENLNPVTITTEYSMIDLVSFNADGSAKYPQVIDAVKKADVISVCIGANDVLEAALNYVMPYLEGTKDLTELAAIVEENLIRLAGDGEDTSYKSLLNKISSLVKPTAKVVFTTVYNPLKYLHLFAGTREKDFMDSFLGVWLETLVGDIPVVGDLIKRGLMESEAVTELYARINELSGWAERYLESKGAKSKYFVKRNANGTLNKDAQGNVIIELEEYEQDKAPEWKGLNQVIRDSLADFNNPNFMIAESHEVFDCVPDSQGAGELHYQDLVHVEICKGYDANNLPWDKLWGDGSGDDPKVQMVRYWTNLIAKHSTLSDGINTDTLSKELVDVIIAKVLYPCLDVHPKAHGHYAMYRAFADTLGWQSLNTVTYNANGGTSTMESQKVLDYSIVNGVSKKIYSVLKANAFSPQTGHHFTGWKNRNGNSYSDEQAIPITSDITLDAQWAKNKWTLTVIQADKTVQVLDALDSVDYSNRQLQINKLIKSLNSNKSSWNDPIYNSNTETFEVEYGTPIMLSVQGRVEVSYDFNNRAKKPNCTIYQHNGSAYVVDNPDTQIGKLVTADFYMPDEDVTIEYWFNYASSTSIFASYSHRWWEAYIRNKNLEVKYTSSNG